MDSNNNLNSPPLINSPLNNSFEKKVKSKPITPHEYNSNNAENKNNNNNSSGLQNKQNSALASKQQNSSKTSKTNSNTNLLIFSKQIFISNFFSLTKML